MVAMVYIDSQTGFLGCVPVRSKGQYSLMVQELVSFPQLLGYTEVVYRADNEPTARQLLKLVVDTRLRMGLRTRSSTPPPYSHGNALAENCIARIRGLTGSLMFSLFEQLNMKFSTNSALWSWCMRHACWLLNRYAPYRGVTPYELVYGKGYAGSICQYGEPIFGFVRGPNKGDASWRRMIFLGKVEAQDSFVCFDGGNIVLTKSVRRVATSWKSHLGFYVSFKNASWEFKTGAWWSSDPHQTGQRTNWLQLQPSTRNHQRFSLL